MHPKALRFHGSARDKICAGLNTLANAVKVTLGPKGRTVILEHAYGAPTVINSGVVVAREIELEDHFENVGAHLAREVAAKTSETAGDGTTTATVLAQAIVNDGLRYVTAGLDPMDVKRGIEAAVTAVVAEVKRNSKPCATNQEIAQVGTISANGDADIGAMIADAMAKVGENGVIKSEEGRGRTNELEIVEGMQFDRGYLSPYFVTDTGKRRIVLEDASVLLYDDTISGIAALLPILEEVAREGRPLLVVAEDVAGEALATLVLNTLRGVIRTCAVKAPGFGDNRKLLLQDMAILTGGALVSADMGMTLETVKLAQLGRVRRIEIDKDSTTLIGSAGTAEAIRTRLGQLRSEREKATTDYDRGQLDDRIARISGGVALIKVGASTETEMREKRSRVEDALHATRAAMAEGIGPGGGVALLRARHVLDAMKGPNLAQDAGIRIVARALEEPLRQIVANAGQDPAVVLERVLAGSGNEGYNAATNQYGDVVAMGIIDPTKVTRLALENAASIASLILTTDCVIADTAEASAETEESELA